MAAMPNGVRDAQSPTRGRADHFSFTPAGTTGPKTYTEIRRLSAQRDAAAGLILSVTSQLKKFLLIVHASIP
jgi:hypothetical protein